MLLSGPSRGPSIEKFLSQNARYETKSFTALVTEYLMKFEKEIDGYLLSLGKDGFAYIRNLFSGNAQMLQTVTVFKRNWLNLNMMVLHAMCILRNSYVNFGIMMCNSYEKFYTCYSSIFFTSIITAI